MPVSDTSRYTADYRYSFGYDDWHANTLSLVYTNYGDNHFWTSGGRRHTYFEQGAITLAYKFSLPKPVENALLINKGDAIICRAGYSWVPRYYDLSSNDIRQNKNVLLGGCGYTFKQHFFVRVTAFWFRTRVSSNRGTVITVIASATQATHQDRFQYSMRTIPEHVIPAIRAVGGKFREGTISLIWFLPI